MKKFLLILMFIVFMAQPCLSAVDTFDTSIETKSTWKNSYRWTGRPKDKLKLWANEVEDKLDGTESVSNFYFEVTDTVPTATQGRFYFDLSENKLKFYDGSGWVALDAGTSGNSLDGAYDVGSTITADSGAVAITVSAASGNAGITVAQNDAANNSHGIVVTMCSSNTGSGLHVDGTSGTVDLLGDNFTVLNTGAATFLSVALENGEVISNATNDKILFDTGDEDLLLDMVTTANTITLGANSTGATTFAMGDFVTLTGLNTLTGAAGVDYTISTANTGTFNLVLAQTGVGDNELRLTSAGTAANAIALTSATGGLTVTTVDDIILTCASTTTDDNITIQQTGAFAAGVDILAAGTGTDAILLSASAGGVTLTATGAASGDVVITTVDDFSLVATDDITIDGNSAGSIITIGGNNDGNAINIGVDDTAADAITIGSVKDTIIIDGIAATFGDTTAAAATIIQSGTGDLALTSTDEITLTVATTTTDNIILTNTAGTSVTEDTGAINLIATAGAVIIQSDANLDHAVQIRADGGTTAEMTIHNDRGTSATAIEIVADAGGIVLDANGTAALWTLTADSAGDDLSLIQDGAADGSIVLTSAGTAANAIDINTSAGGIDIDMAGGIAGEDFNLTTATSFVLTSSEAGATDAIDLNATGAVSGIDMDTTNGAIALTAGNATNGDINLVAANDVTVGTTGDIVLTIGGHARVVDDDLVSFGTGDDVTLNYDEDGEDNLQIKGAVDLETTYVQFRQEPLALKKNSESLATGAAGDENLLLAGFPLALFEYHVIGTATDIVPELGALGLDIGLDDAENDGMEFTEGITARSSSAFTTGSHAFYLEVVIYVTDASGSDDMRIGFREVQAYDATIDDYDEMWAVGLISADWNSWTINADQATSITDLDPSNSGDTEAHTVRIEVAANLAVTIEIDGVTPGNAPVTAVTTGKVFIPFLYYIHDGDFFEAFQITSWECGLL